MAESLEEIRLAWTVMAVQIEIQAALRESFSRNKGFAQRAVLAMREQELWKSPYPIPSSF